MTHILLIRHGETDWNRQGRRQGRIDVPLNQAGREQSLTCGQALVALPVDLILTSPLSRATETARIVAGCLGYPDDRIRCESGLIERDFGDIDGMTPAQLRAYRAKGGAEHLEPLENVRARMLETLRTYGNGTSDRTQTILMISHSAAIKTVFSQLYRQPDLQRKPTKNAGISMIDADRDGLHAVAFDLRPEDARRYLQRVRMLT